MLVDIFIFGGELVLVVSVIIILVCCFGDVLCGKFVVIVVKLVGICC